MKHKNIQISLSCLLGILLLIFACRKDEQPDLRNSKDPCKCASEVSADFVIDERWGSVNSKYTITDTVFKNKTVRFTAIETGAEYTWYVGSEVAHEQSVDRFFEEQWAGYDIPITLVVKKEPNTTCFPNDDGYDSITKTFHISHYPISDFNNDTIILGSIAGTYRVKSPDLVDSFDIKFWASYAGMEHQINFNMTNYDGKGSNCINGTRMLASNYRQVWGAPGVYSCKYLQGYIHNKMDGVVEMKLTYSESGEVEDRKERTYLGRKLK